MAKIIHTDRAGFENYMNDFLQDEITKKTLMVRCYNYHDSIQEVLKALQNSPLVHTGIVKVRSMNNNQTIFEGFAPRSKLNKITQDSSLGDDNFAFQIEKRNYFDEYNNDYDVAVYVPIQNILLHKDKVDKMKGLLRSTDTKTILITTNDYDKNPEVLYEALDEVLILDTSNESNNIKKINNIKAKYSNMNEKLPY